LIGKICEIKGGQEICEICGNLRERKDEQEIYEICGICVRERMSRKSA